MNRTKYSFKCLFFIFTLLLFTACERDGHLYVTFINNSNAPVWVHIAPHVYDEGLETFQPGRFNDYVEASDTLQIGSGSGFKWESSWHTGEMLVICVYSKSLNDKLDSESYKEFEQKYLLEKKWYTKEELNNLKWIIHYYSKENNIKSDHND